MLPVAQRETTKNQMTKKERAALFEKYQANFQETLKTHIEPSKDSHAVATGALKHIMERVIEGVHMVLLEQ